MTCPQDERSRICVKNLPRYVTDDRLRKCFSLKGEITDTKIMLTKDGKSRQFGFIGYRTEQEAEEAIKYFHNSFMDTCRITCEIARKVGHPQNPRPWSQYSLKKHKNPSTEEKIVPSCKCSEIATRGESIKSKKDDGGDDPQLQEFLQVMQPYSKSKLWANDAASSSCIEQGRGASNKKCHLSGNKYGLFRDTLKQDVLKGDAEVTGLAVPPSSKDEKVGILETNRLRVLNVPYIATEEELEEHFSKFGDISEIHLLVDKDTKQSKGQAFVGYILPESAARALEVLNNSSFQGRLLKIEPATEKDDVYKQDSNNFTEQSTKTFKQLRNEERKASESSGNTRGWNRLFMSTDTVNENIARKFGVSKSELLDREADDLAVRVALGETEVIAETKRALSNAGINVSSFELSGKTDGLKRSRIILVKNLPYGASQSELADMFGKYGNLDKLILPPTKTLALVIFVEPAEAYASFQGLRYKHYKGLPLYLELMPDCILSQTPMSTGNSDDNDIVGEHDSTAVLREQVLEDITDVGIDPDMIESSSLYVKNLNFKTSDEDLKRHFAGHVKEGRVLSATIVKKRLKNGTNVSTGFGFVEFDSIDTAVKVRSDVQGTNLNGHTLILQLCHAKRDERRHKKVASNQSSTKLMVKNVAFEATEKEIRQLFAPFGQVKRVRIPRRFANHRGFAFVEYVTKQEAGNALKLLAHTHLYGRRLVIERAKESESLKELRARTAAHFSDPINLSKKRKHMAVLDQGNVKFERIN